MRKQLILSLLMGGLMLLAAALSHFLTPTQQMYKTRPDVNLEHIVPFAFADWQVDSNVPDRIVNPQEQQFLDKLYSDTLSRTYIGANGTRIMLSLAYGRVQSRSLQVHLPGNCYRAQGFHVSSFSKDKIRLDNQELPVMRMPTRLEARYEPVTYWVRVGEHIALNGPEQSVMRIRYGLSGVVPDGLLVRVSSISANSAVAYAEQDRFVRDLLAALPEDGRDFLLGKAL